MVRIFKTRETKSYRSLLLFAFTFFLGIGYASGQVDLSTINHAVKQIIATAPTTASPGI
jgi:hypothetical protein